MFYSSYLVGFCFGGWHGNRSSSQLKSGALGFISYALIKAFSGRGREISWLTYTLAIVLVFYFLFVRSQIG
jgi:hypothetical protein